MSRVGKKPIEIPQGVEVKIEDQKVVVKGPKGELQKEVQPEIKVEVAENKILVQPSLGKEGVKKKQTRALWGLVRAQLANMVKGVTQGFERKLEIEGVGYRAVASLEDIELFVGLTHSIKIKAPQGVKFLVEKNIITVSGSDIEAVSQTAAKIKKSRPVEPYKGKGIKYLGEIVRRKVGKKVVATAGA